jgi:hypothetical protein
MPRQIFGAKYGGGKGIRTLDSLAQAKSWKSRQNFAQSAGQSAPKKAGVFLALRSEPAEDESAQGSETRITLDQ